MIDPILRKTFGGLSLDYYFRHLIFSLFLTILFIFSVEVYSIELFAFSFFNTFLYPYSRFAYRSGVNYLSGNEGLIINHFLILVIKFLTMLLCWGLALFIAPIGLLLLFLYHSQQAKS
ncbi:hypothetical protein [Crocosphaera chwakensis]|uniref:Uncharacterized protein n=1 Tax=Crocosphaera chwakensis CCY0110 TaxID=391612 RepID=A3IM93_9CHRO|nr:hypothetical protein [Crocosphaera chwakensis]EAZ92549.1 hypothetical protein CY0110_02449 [Crocosphaera chwakensis CCY0110]